MAEKKKAGLPCMMVSCSETNKKYADLMASDRVIHKAIEAEFKDDGELSGIEFLRCAVTWFNRRAETRNENKAPKELLVEYAHFVLSGGDSQIF